MTEQTKTDLLAAAEIIAQRRYELSSCDSCDSVGDTNERASIIEKAYLANMECLLRAFT